MLLELFFIIILIFFYLKPKYIETFNTYKSIEVTPQPTIYSKIKINSFYKGSLYENISKNISNIYPIFSVNYTNGSMDNIIKTNNNINHLSLVQDNALSTYLTKNPTNNIRFISSLGIEQLTLIVPFKSNINNWYDLKNKKIGTLNINTGSYYTLKNILNTFEILSTIVPLKLNNILQSFNNNLIDAFFIITSHPSNIITNIHNNFPIKFIGIDKLNKDILTKIFPFSPSSYIDTSNYDILTKIQIETIDFKVNLICHKNLKNIDSYNLIKTIFSNFIFIKTTGNDDYKTQMKYFNPQDLYLSNSLYKLHNGVRKYYIDIGLISYSKEYSCRYSVGVKKCNEKKLNHFRLL